MIRKYMIERRSWIILFLALQALFLLIAYLDASIPFQSILYIVFLSCIIFILFLMVRFQKETTFYKELEALGDDFDLISLKDARTPFEKITNTQLTDQAQYYKKSLSDLLISVEQEKDDLLGWIHEVKTPLTTMQLMMDRMEDERLKAQLNNEWLRIHLLLDQQLHQRRIPFIKNDLYIEVTALEALLYKEIKDLKSWCMQKGIGFDISLQNPEVLTDAKWLSFMVRQLLTNAVKYSENSDILISSYLEAGQIKLVIQDAGRGIDPRDLPRIFDKGFTSTTSHQDNAATGMGLYLTKKAAASLAIEIDVQSTLGEGTTFTLTFPKKNTFVQLTSM
ncbi:sensor histidine kinase [Oceanobacillus profundus]|uniref:histidine kinase n=1 Tax=Oceanobacillus profundus TaxID=372463 RepID=A0A417YN36_9BACI|nr:sensor histidine kinase [Oceanobacillus profundus]MBR3121077.1 sensor histidine kinase [Oceanobacillus sp.]MCM3398626.1 sensor histidine kinase [Oceanobacillus profundus]MDO6447747.1 sensor histidine kinase [Oceanobacillus profundus]RHW35175.1 sensor histidine kinase [Oceanobacillus profundus]